MMRVIKTQSFLQLKQTKSNFPVKQNFSTFSSFSKTNFWQKNVYENNKINNFNHFSIFNFKNIAQQSNFFATTTAPPPQTTSKYPKRVYDPIRALNNSLFTKLKEKNVKDLEQQAKQIINKEVESNERTLNTLLDLCVVAKDKTLLDSIYKEYLKRGYKPNTTIYNCLISSTVETKNLNAALEYVKEMKKKQIPLSASTYLSLLHVYHAVDNNELPQSLYREMIENKVQINAKILNKLLQIFQNDTEKFNYYLSQFQLQNIPYNSITYRLLLSYAKDQRNFESAQHYFAKFRELETPDHLILNDMISFSLELLDYPSASEYFALFDELKHKNVFPTTLTYVYFINYFISQTQIDLAKIYISKTQIEGAKLPNVFAECLFLLSKPNLTPQLVNNISILFKLVKEYELELDGFLREFLRVSQKRGENKNILLIYFYARDNFGVIPSSRTIDILLKFANEAQTLTRLYRDIKPFNILHNFTYSSLISSFAENRAEKMVAEVFADVKQKNLIADPSFLRSFLSIESETDYHDYIMEIYDFVTKSNSHPIDELTLIRCFINVAKHQHVDSAIKFYDEFARREILVSGRAFNTLIKHSIHLIEVESGFNLLMRMLSDFATSVKSTENSSEKPRLLYNLNFVISRSSLEQADQIWKQLIITKNIEPNKTTYGFLIFASKRNIHLADSYYRMMIQHFPPTSLDFKNLLDSCENSGDKEKAARYFTDMKNSNVGINIQVFFSLFNIFAGDLPQLEFYYSLMLETFQPHPFHFIHLVSASAGNVERGSYWLLEYLKTKKEIQSSSVISKFIEVFGEEEFANFCEKHKNEFNFANLAK